MSPHIASLHRWLLLSACLCAASAAHAQTTVIWNFGTSSGTLSPTSGTPVSSLLISALSSINGGVLDNSTTSATGNGTYTGFSGGFNAGVRAESGGLNLATSTYFTFTLTPDNGYQVQLSNLTLGSRSTATGPLTVSIFSNQDNYSSSLASFSPSSNSNWALLSPSSFTSVVGTAAAPLTLRIYGYGNSSEGTGNWRIDDLSATMAVSAVPEPATYATIAGALVLVGAMLHRRRQRSRLRALEDQQRKTPADGGR